VVTIAGPEGGAAAAQPVLALRLGPAGKAEFPADALQSQPAAIAKAVSAFLNQR
jgi:hypothetical protein